MADEVFKQEETQLNKTINIVKDSRVGLKSKLESIGKENLDKLYELRSEHETGVDFEMFIEQLNQKNQSLDLKGKFDKLAEYEYLSKSPYFARLDFKEHKQEKAETIYIGKFGLTLDKPVITDWRTSIASIYYKYRYPQKDVVYKTPVGDEHADLLLKRTYDIHDAKLVKYYNNDIQLDENEIVVDKIKQRTGGVLEDIVETIQKDQIDIIEADPRQICVVQGCVGSGKSTVAIHKLAHIFFNYPNYIHPKRSILVVKNQILVGYLSTLFPKLGIFDLNYKTLRDLVVNFLFREGLSVNVDLNLHVEHNFTLPDVYSKLDQIYYQYEQKIKNIFNTAEFESYGGYKYSTDLSPYENINDILSDIMEEEESILETLKENPDSTRAGMLRSNLRTIKSLRKKLTELRLGLKAKALPDLLNAFQIDTDKKLDYSQTLMYLLCYSKVVGLTKFLKYEYCVLDEGQDFTTLELAVLNNFVLRGRFAIFGDLNQSIFEGSLPDWQNLTDVIPEAKKAKVFSLETNYRSTKPIIDLANSVLGKYTQQYLPKSLNRAGPEPVISKYKDVTEAMEKFKKLIFEDVTKNEKSIGVVCLNSEIKSAAEVALTNLNLKTGSYAILDESKSVNFTPKGIYVATIEEAKGLEFSKVYILGLNLDTINDVISARKAFVAVTRAMNELIILGC